ncbi:unnamed protein product [Cuscuta europaea]|uniref:Uncharacterized protein ycf68 n=1 Tax=Cuscuta europaea TaxID=41803 RepID=A0A9P1ELC5_CUSEU|nr:unnamed protein product [Cuscuta europaea]
MDSSMCSSAPDPEMWIIQGTLAWRTPLVQYSIGGFKTKLLPRRIDEAIRVRSNVDPTFDHSWDPGGPGGTTMAPLFSRILIYLISVWTAISRAQVYIWFQWEKST